MRTSTFFRLCSRAPTIEMCFAVARAPLRWQLDARALGEIKPRRRFGIALDGSRRALRDDAAAELTGARAEVEQPVGRPHGLLVVLDHDDRVAEIAQAT